METYKTKVENRICVIYQEKFSDVTKPVTRKELVDREWVIDPPVVIRRTNRYRKDGKLTPEQQENLEKNYGLSPKVTAKMTEAEILAILRKKHKHYKFNQINLN